MIQNLVSPALAAGTGTSQVLVQVLVLFLLLLTGFLGRRLHAIDGAGIRGMTSLIIKITLPAMIIDSMATQTFSMETLGGSGLILLISFVIYGVLMLVAIPLARMFKAPPRDTGVIRFVLVFSNVGFMGFPVIEAVFGKEALFYTAIYNLPFNLLVFTLGILMLLKGHESEKSKAFSIGWKHLLSPVMLSIIAGFVLFLTQVKMPGPLLKAFSLAGSVTTPLSMLLIGAMLAGASLRETIRDGRLYLIAFIRLLVWPVAVFFTLRALTDNFWFIAIPTIITAMPAAANTALLANEHDANEKLASQAIFISTLFSVLTIPLIAALIDYFS